MVKDKEQIVKNLKLKEFYDPNALHDLKEINDLDNIIKDLMHNKQMYLKTFVESKILTKDELLSLIPDHKLDQMLIKGLTYFKYLGLFDFHKNPRSLFDYELKVSPLAIYDRFDIDTEELQSMMIRKFINNECVVFNQLKLESFVVAGNAIICLPINKEEFTKHNKNHRFDGKTLITDSSYYLNRQHHGYKRFFIELHFDGLTNDLELLKITTQERETGYYHNNPIYYSKKYEER